MNIEVERRLVTKTGRVKDVDFHTSEPWIACALYSGELIIYDFNTKLPLRNIKLSSLPLRCCRFVPKKNLIVACGDDQMIRAIQIGTQKCVWEQEAHQDYIRSMAMHPTKNLLLTTSDDTSIKLWDMDTFTLRTTYSAHNHFVMDVKWHRDGETFVSCSLDQTIKVWSCTETQSSNVTAPRYQMNGHTAGINSIAIIDGAESVSEGKAPMLNVTIPLLASAGDDGVRIWDYSSKQCLHHLKDHTSPVQAVAFHRYFPLLITAGEDNFVKLFNLTNFKLEANHNFHMDRIWGAQTCPGDATPCAIAFATDSGLFLVDFGRPSLVASLQNSGRFTFCRGQSVQISNIRALSPEVIGIMSQDGSTPIASGTAPVYTDGENVHVPTKELGLCDVFPQQCLHDSTGRLLAVCGDDDYVIYTAQALRSRAFGKAQAIAWSAHGSDYATLNDSKSPSKAVLQLYHDFEATSYKIHTGEAIISVCGGPLIGVIAAGESVSFYTWGGLPNCEPASCCSFAPIFVSRIDIPTRMIVWDSSGKMVVLVGKECSTIYMYDRRASSEEVDGQESYPTSLTIVTTIEEQITSCKWIRLADMDPSEAMESSVVLNSSVLVFTTAQGKVLMWYGRPTYETYGYCKPGRSVVGYSATHQAIVMVDGRYSISFYRCPMAYVHFQLLIIKDDVDAARKILRSIPRLFHPRASTFLEQGQILDLALELSTDAGNRFDIMLRLGDLEGAAKTLGEMSTTKYEGVLEEEWKRLGNEALSRNEFELAMSSFKRAGDWSSCLFTCLKKQAAGLGSRAHSADLLDTEPNSNSIPEIQGEIINIGQKARENGSFNVAQLAYLYSGRTLEVYEMYLECGRYAEAATFARNYLPNRVKEATAEWQKVLGEDVVVEY